MCHWYKEAEKSIKSSKLKFLSYIIWIICRKLFSRTPTECNQASSELRHCPQYLELTVKFMFCALIQALSVSTDTYYFFQILYQFSSVSQSCLNPCDPRDCRTPGSPVHHQLPEPSQTHVHWVGDAIQPSHPLSSPSPPAFTLSQHQDIFQWVSYYHQVAKVLEFQLQPQSFQWIFGTDFL